MTAKAPALRQRLPAQQAAQPAPQAGRAAPGLLTAPEILRLQRAVGNRATGRLLAAAPAAPRQSGPPTLQRLISVAVWQEQTKTGYFPPRPRSTVATIDGPLGVYNANPNRANVNALITALRAYIHDKETNDPTNVRLGPARNLLRDALQDKGNLVSADYDVAHAGHAVSAIDMRTLSELPMVQNEGEVHQLVNHAKSNQFIYYIGTMMAANHTFADLLAVVTGFPLFFQNPPNRARAGRIVQLLSPLSGADMILVFNRLYNNDPTRPADLLEALRHDGATPVQIRDMVAQLFAAGLGQDDIYTMIRRQRQHLDTAGGNPALPITQQDGTKGLSGPELVAHTNQARTALAPVDPRTHYPTGQDFSARTIAQLWNDCNLNYPGKTQIPNETNDQKLRRQKLALGELMTRHPARRQIIQNVFTHKEGSEARPFVSVASEDAYVPGAHTVDRHTLGGANMPDRDAVATRALTKVPVCNEVASVYQSVADANSAVKAALRVQFPAGWAAFRDSLTTGAPLPALNHAMGGVRGLAYRKTDAPNAVAAALDPLRPLRQDAPLDNDPSAGPPPVPQTYAVSLTGLIVVFRPEDASPAAHGWGILTSYPTTPHP